MLLGLLRSAVKMRRPHGQALPKEEQVAKVLIQLLRDPTKERMLRKETSCVLIPGVSPQSHFCSQLLVWMQLTHGLLSMGCLPEEWEEMEQMLAFFSALYSSGFTALSAAYHYPLIAVFCPVFALAQSAPISKTIWINCVKDFRNIQLKLRQSRADSDPRQSEVAKLSRLDGFYSSLPQGRGKPASTLLYHRSSISSAQNTSGGHC